MNILGTKQWIHCNEEILCNENSLQWKVCNENNENFWLKFIIFCLKLEILWKNITKKCNKMPLFKFHANFVPDSRISIFPKDNLVWNWKIMKKLSIKNAIKLQGRGNFLKKFLGLAQNGQFFLSPNFIAFIVFIAMILNFSLLHCNE